MSKDVVYVGRPLSLSQVERVARRFATVAIAPEAIPLIEQSRAPVDRICSSGDDAEAVYGINTGFGALSETRIDPHDLRELQRNLVRSHATGIGRNLDVDVVRAMILLRVQVLALGHSGVRLALVLRLCELLNHRVHPRIPNQGSVGASGDLAPLAHLALVLIGEGEVIDDRGVASPALPALEKAGLVPLELEAKEGLSLINGTQFMTAIGALAQLDAERLCTTADIAGAISLEAQMGTSVPFDARLHRLRPHPGQELTASNLRKLLADSDIAKSHENCGRVQDAYSLRCMPQVHGASRDALAWARAVLEREVNSVTDNPSVFVDGDTTDVLSGGNFHGQPVAFALDLAAMAVAELANISERRVEQLVNPALSSGLTPFLAAGSGLHSGFMIAQVAAASLVAENKVLCHPASVDSIPSSAGREDHVSMGSVSAKKLADVVINVRRGLAIEVMVACAGVDQRAPHAPSRGVAAALSSVRAKVAPMTGDRVLYPDIEAIERLLLDGSFLAGVERAVGPLT
ncbi:MAG: histidine ammonia-lyase [Polyangiaceae bacterium]